MNYRIVAYPPTAEMQAAAYASQCEATDDGISRIFEAMLSASPQPDTVLTTAEGKRIADQLGIRVDQLWAAEAAVLRKLGGKP